METQTADRDEAFRQFTASRWPRLLRTAYLLTGERHAAEDLVQSALERTYLSWRRVRRADDQDAYVRRILINQHARRFRGGRREYPTAEAPTGTADRSDRIAQAETRLTLLDALAGLPPRQRQAVVLRYWEDLSERQTADAMDCSTGTVKSQTAKALAKLRDVPGLGELVGRRPDTRHETPDTHHETKESV
jgi:RNA polymerase sigma-70 factor (sigma-E family)